MAKRRLETDHTSGAHRIKIKNKKHQSPEWTVIGHLPDGFGFSVGSEIGTPFAGFASDGNVAKILYLTTNSSAKAGLITKKMFMGPEQSEISFDMEFQAYYSGFDEVIDPIVRLMMFSTGHQKEIGEIAGEAANNYLNISGKAAEISASFLGDGEEINRPKFAFMQGPGICTIQFGKVMKLRNVYLSSVTPTFSNSLDNEGYPLSGSVSISGQLEQPMTKDQLASTFQKGRQRIFLSENDRNVGNFSLSEEYEDASGFNQVG